MTTIVSEAEEIQHPETTYLLFRLLGETSGSIVKARRRWIHEFNISPIRLDVLHAVASSGNKATPSEISRLVFREPHSVSSLLERMEKRGLIKKVKDLEKKNMVRVALTAKGRTAYNQATREDPIYKIASALSEEEIQQLMTFLMDLRYQAMQQDLLSQAKGFLRP